MQAACLSLGKPPDTSAQIANASGTRWDGVWLTDAANRGDGVSWLSAVWSSKVTIVGDRFTISNFRGTGKNLTGSLVWDTAGKGTIDFKVSEFVLSETRNLKYPACTLPGMYRLEGESLTICFSVGPEPRRPAQFKPSGNKEILFRLVRVGGSFKEFPSDVTIKVLDPVGNPAVGTEVCGMITHVERQPGESGWKYLPKWGKTGDDGTAKVHYADLASHPIIAHDAATKMSGIAAASPVALQAGAITIRLGPERLIGGTLTCGEAADGGKVPTWSNVYLMQAGQRIGNFASTGGRFSFLLPAGSYTLDAYGVQLAHKIVPVTVPPGDGEVQIPPIALMPVEFFDNAGNRREAVRNGIAAPELEAVTAWKGEAVRLSDQRGKVVLLNFWGYWCGPCVSEMPVLIELHERFKDKGLAVVGVHVDGDGEIDSAAKFEAAIASPRKAYWGGKKTCPFPVAASSRES